MIIFILVKTWNRHNGDSGGSPAFAPYATVKAARKALQESIKEDHKSGITNDGNYPDDWEITDTPDLFDAWDISSDEWVRFEIVKKKLLS